MFADFHSQSPLLANYERMKRKKGDEQARHLILLCLSKDSNGSIITPEMAGLLSDIYIRVPEKNRKLIHTFHAVPRIILAHI